MKKVFGYLLLAVGVVLALASALVMSEGINKDTFVIVSVVWAAFCINESKGWFITKK